MASARPKTYLAFVLDESGSMESCRQATISGYNEYLATLRSKKDVGIIRATLTKFNTLFIQVYTNIKLKDIVDLTLDTYVPSGATALYDAIAHTILDIDKLITDKDRVLCVILTDGQENSSKEYTREQIFQMIQEREAKGNWTFVYIGANQDAYAVGASMGIPSANAMNYDTKQTEGTFRSLANATSSYARQSNKQSSSFWK